MRMLRPLPEGVTRPRLPALVPTNVRFSNRSCEVKHFETVRHCQCPMSHCGLVIFVRNRLRRTFRHGRSKDEAEQARRRPYRLTNVQRSTRTSELTASIVPRGTSCHGFVERRVFADCIRLPAALIAVANAPGPDGTRCRSSHMRCRIAANRRASATIACFIPSDACPTCIAQALSQDHIFEHGSWRGCCVEHRLHRFHLAQRDIRRVPQSTVARLHT